MLGFIDDQTPIASGSPGTQQHRSWNRLQNGEELDDFLAGIYERSRANRVRPTVEDPTDRQDCIRSLPGADEFPLWRIGCRVRLSFEKLKKINSLLGGP
jgi:hypothetical protein